MVSNKHAGTAAAGIRPINRGQVQIRSRGIFGGLAEVPGTGSNAPSENERCDADAAREVMKYAVKPGDLVDSAEPIGPVIRMIDKTRLITTFGSVFGIGADDDEEKRPFGCACGDPSWIPAEQYLRSMIGEKAIPLLVAERKAASREQRRRELSRN